MLLDTHPVLLAVTIFVSILHAIFEFLAFKVGFLYCIYQFSSKSIYAWVRLVGNNNSLLTRRCISSYVFSFRMTSISGILARVWRVSPCDLFSSTSSNRSSFFSTSAITMRISWLKHLFLLVSLLRCGRYRRFVICHNVLHYTGSSRNWDLWCASPISPMNWN